MLIIKLPTLALLALLIALALCAAAIFEKPWMRKAAIVCAAIDTLAVIIVVLA